MKHPVVHFEIVGKDAPTLYGFYRELFDWNIQDMEMPGGRYGIVAAEDGQIGGGIGATEQVEGHVTFYVEVDDVEAALAKAESLGGKRLFGPDEVMEGLVLGQFSDPAGNTIGVLRGSS
jgi:uncharacterized protein